MTSRRYIGPQDAVGDRRTAAILTVDAAAVDDRPVVADRAVGQRWAATPAVDAAAVDI